MRSFLVPVCLLSLVAISISKSEINSDSDNLQEEDVIYDQIVETVNGPVTGIILKSRDPSKEYVAFLGLRYSEKTKRFEKPEKLEEKWTESKIASKPGSECVQVTFPFGTVEGEEDCNFLNIYVPKKHLESGTEKLPVMVWIHGGGFAFGDGYNYSASYFMENEDVILVTINYRLGAFGFLSTEDEVIPGNNGLRDMAMALTWINENIEAFKGSSDSVTIFGESAGAVAVNYLLMSPLTKGLFHKAIMQSGAFTYWGYDPYPRENAIKLASYLGCDLTGEGRVKESIAIKECLENISLEKLGKAQAAFKLRWPATNAISRFVPTATETKSPFFSSEPKSFFTSESNRKPEYVSKVPVMIGVNKDEGSFFSTSMVVVTNKLQELNHKWDEVAQKAFAYEDFFPKKNLPEVSKLIREYYFGSEILSRENIEKLDELYSDTHFFLPAISSSLRMAEQGITVYPFEFSYLGELSLSKIFGLPDRPGTVGHADDLQYFFLNPFMSRGLKPDSDDEKFSKNMIKMWTHFAKNGKPNPKWSESELTWTPLKSTSEDITEFDVLEFNKEPKEKKVDFRKKIEFWTGLQKKYGFKTREKSEL